MTAPLSDILLEAITARDEAAADGLSVQDNHVTLDRHLLLTEVLRLRALTTRLQQGRPTRTIDLPA